MTSSGLTLPSSRSPAVSRRRSCPAANADGSRSAAASRSSSRSTCRTTARSSSPRARDHGRRHARSRPAPARRRGAPRPGTRAAGAPASGVRRRGDRLPCARAAPGPASWCRAAGLGRAAHRGWRARRRAPAGRARCAAGRRGSRGRDRAACARPRSGWSAPPGRGRARRRHRVGRRTGEPAARRAARRRAPRRRGSAPRRAAPRARAESGCSASGSSAGAAPRPTPVRIRTVFAGGSSSVLRNADCASSVMRSAAATIATRAPPSTGSSARSRTRSRTPRSSRPPIGMTRPAPGRAEAVHVGVVAVLERPGTPALAARPNRRSSARHSSAGGDVLGQRALADAGRTGQQDRVRHPARQHRATAATAAGWPRVRNRSSATIDPAPRLRRRGRPSSGSRGASARRLPRRPPAEADGAALARRAFVRLVVRAAVARRLRAAPSRAPSRAWRREPPRRRTAVRGGLRRSRAERGGP